MSDSMTAQDNKPTSISNDELSYRDQQMREALISLVEPQFNSMAEAVFRVKFLPFFKLEGIPPEDLPKLLASIPRHISPRPNEDTLRSLISHEYLSEVRNPYLETEVFNDRDEIVFIIPPFFIRQDSVIINRNLNVSDVVTAAINQDRIHPRLGDRVIDEGLTPFIGQPTKDIRYLEMWNKIYDYYGTKQYDLSFVDKPDSEDGDDTVPDTGLKVDENGIRVIDEDDDDDGF